MAQRFLVASGNWSSTAVWSTTNNGAPGASVPGANDFARGSSFTSYTVGLTSDITVDLIVISTGTINSNNHTINCRLFSILDPGSTVVNLGTSTLNTGSISGSGPINGQNATVNIDTDTFGINPTILGGNAFNMQLGTVNLLGGKNVSIGNANITSLVAKKIDPLNISFRGGTTTLIRRFIAKGVSSANRLRLNKINTGNANITMLGSNQLWAFKDVDITDINVIGLGQYYAGSTSVDGGGNSGILFQDAPLVRTFTDTFTGGTINSAKWSTNTLSGGAVTQTGGVVRLSGNSSSSFAQLISKDQFLLDGSSVTFKLSRALGPLGFGSFSLATATSQYGITSRRNIPNIGVSFGQTSTNLFIQGQTTDTTAYTLTDSYIRLRESSGTIYYDSSANGITYTNRESYLLSDYGIDSEQILARPIFEYAASSGGDFDIEDFNIDLTPTADFTGTPLSISRGSSVAFTDTSNFSPTSWSWTFGDSGTSTLQNPSRTYALPGLYTVGLTSSNSVDSDSESKTDYITVTKVIQVSSIDGGFVFGGEVIHKLEAKRSIEGTLVFGGVVIGVLDSDSGKIERKTYMYKVYDEDGNFISVLDDVISQPTWSEEINRTGSTARLELGRNSDSLTVGVEPLLDNLGAVINDSNTLPILTTVQSRNKVGVGSNIAHNYRVDIFVFYGSIEPLIDNNELNILDNNNDTILTTIGAPNGSRRFTGFISEINIRYGESETTEILLMSYGFDLDQYLIKSGSNTTVTYSAQDPGAIIRSALDNFATQGGSDIFTSYSAATVEDAGMTTSLTFRANTVAEVIQQAYQVAPSGHFYYVDLGTNLVNFRDKSATAERTFLLGKHIKSLDLRTYIGDVVNQVLFTGGDIPASPFKLYTRALQTGTRRGLKRISDARVTLVGTADSISNAELDSKVTVQYRSTVTILSEAFDIESINLGETVQFRNFDNFVDDLNFQIVAKTYTPDFVTLQLDTLPRNVNRVIDTIQRQLEVEQNNDVPVAPTT